MFSEILNVPFYSRIYQAAKLMLYFPSSGLYYCPVAMSDGAARILEVGFKSNIV